MAITNKFFNHFALPAIRSFIHQHGIYNDLSQNEEEYNNRVRQLFQQHSMLENLDLDSIDMTKFNDPDGKNISKSEALEFMKEIEDWLKNGIVEAKKFLASSQVSSKETSQSTGRNTNAEIFELIHNYLERIATSAHEKNLSKLIETLQQFGDFITALDDKTILQKFNYSPSINLGGEAWEIIHAAHSILREYSPVLPPQYFAAPPSVEQKMCRAIGIFIRAYEASLEDEDECLPRIDRNSENYLAAKTFFSERLMPKNQLAEVNNNRPQVSDNQSHDSDMNIRPPQSTDQTINPNNNNVESSDYETYSMSSKTISEKLKSVSHVVRYSKDEENWVLTYKTDQGIAHQQLYLGRSYNYLQACQRAKEYLPQAKIDQSQMDENIKSFIESFNKVINRAYPDWRDKESFLEQFILDMPDDGKPFSITWRPLRENDIQQDENYITFRLSTNSGASRIQIQIPKDRLKQILEFLSTPQPRVIRP